MKRISFLAIVLLVISSCKQDEKYPVEPVIGFKSLFPQTIKSGSSEDSVKISFEFTDGDADFGHPQGSSDFDIFLIHLNDTSGWSDLKYFLPYIPDYYKDPKKGMKGLATIAIPAAFLVLDSLHPQGDSFQYEIYVKDVAGHESNHFTTPYIYITP